MSDFVRAERKQAKLRIAVTGPSGAGKTFSSLLLAAGIGKRIAVADSENRSASICADRPSGPLKGIVFDIMDIDPPYTVDKFTAAIDKAVAAKYDVLILDSISHEWAGEGGLLAKKESLDQRGGNSYTNWAGITKEHEIFKARMLNAEIHLIVTMRSKQDYVIEENEKGKSAPKKIGLAPVQREGMEYEFTTVFDVAMDHNAAASKDRTSLFDGQIFKITKKTGEQIMDWLKGAKPIEKPEAPKPAPKSAAKPAAASAPQAADKSETTMPWEDPADEGQGDDSPAITEKQNIKISSLIQSIIGPKRSEETVWIGIHKQVPHDFAELSELTALEAEAVIDYLSRWLDHIHPAKGAEA